MISAGLGRWFTSVALFAAAILTTGAVHAQDGSATSIIGFSGNSDEPISIGSQVFEVDTKAKVAFLTGNVVVVQGDVTLKTTQLKVNYEGEIFVSKQASFTRMEALGKIMVVMKDRTLTGDRGVYDLKKNIITVDGNVVLSQGKNVMRGSRLIVDRNTDRYRLEAHKEGQNGRVTGSFIPKPRRPGEGTGQQAPQ